jgi:thymidine kinase
MFAGKTSDIQSVVRRYKCLGKQVLVLTADIDTRYSETSSVINHDQVGIDAHGVPIHGGLLTVFDWPEYAAAPAIVIDEAQFFVGCLIPFVKRAVDIDRKHVVVVGLDSDADRNPFGDVLALISLADSVEKKTALCRRCGDGTSAIFTHRLIQTTDVSNVVSVGGADQYEPVCRTHFLTLTSSSLPATPRDS